MTIIIASEKKIIGYLSIKCKKIKISSLHLTSVSDITVSIVPTAIRTVTGVTGSLGTLQVRITQVECYELRIRTFTTMLVRPGKI
jgi:hypothetical protein